MPIDPGRIGKIISPPKDAAWAKMTLEDKLSAGTLNGRKVRLKDQCVALAETEQPAVRLPKTLAGAQGYLVASHERGNLKVACHLCKGVPKRSDTLSVLASPVISQGSSGCSTWLSAVEDGFVFKQMKLSQPHFWKACVPIANWESVWRMLWVVAFIRTNWA